MLQPEHVPSHAVPQPLQPVHPEQVLLHPEHPFTQVPEQVVLQLPVQVAEQLPLHDEHPLHPLHDVQPVHEKHSDLHVPVQ